MKKLITKFTSIFLAVVVLMSCCVVSVSAESTAEVLNEPLLSSLPEPSLKYLSVFFEDDVLKYDNFIIFRYFYSNKIYYQIINFDDGKNNDLSYFSLSNNASYAYNEDLAYSTFNYVSVTYCQDTDSYVSSSNNSSSTSISNLRLNYYTVNSNDLAVETAVKNIVYSDFDFRYAGLTVFDSSSDNKSIVIPGLLDKSNSVVGPQPIQPVPGDYDFVGPLPLIPVEGDSTYQGFKDWLISNKKYEELSQFGINCTANNISSVVDLWTGNYNSITDFYNSLRTMWSTINVVSQARNIYNFFEEQWELYKKSLITYETIPIRDKDDVLNYDTDYDEEGNFISSETAYLKLILGVLTVFRNDVNNFANNITSYISSLSVNVNRICSMLANLPDSIGTSVYNNFVNPFNAVIDAINDIEIDNSSSSSSTTNNNIDVNIDIDNIDNTTNNFNIAFGDLQLSLENKFSFYNQLTEITNTVQNYNYDDSSIAPELVFSVGSEIGLPDSDYKIDFSFYEPYREMIRKIIITVAYISFAINLLHKLPNIIGGI